MSDLCFNCRKIFGLFRKKYYCEICQKEFCKNCIFRTSLSWGKFEGLRYKIVIKNNKVSYRVIDKLSLKIYSLCISCENIMKEKIRNFKVEIKNKLDSIIVTAQNFIPGYKVIRSFGVIKYHPHSPEGLLGKGSIDYLKNEAIRFGANAFINYKKTYTQKLSSLPPQKTGLTPLDYVPGYPKRKPIFIKIPIFQAEAVRIQKIKE